MPPAKVDAQSLVGSLLKAWRKTRTPELSVLLEATSREHAPPLEDLPLKKGDRATRLQELAGKTSEADRAPLLAAFESLVRDAPASIVWPAIEALADLKPDPRIARMALRTLAALEDQLTAKLWRRLVGCLEEHGDAGIAQEAETYRHTLSTRGVRWNFSLERLTNVLKRLSALKSEPADPALIEEAKRVLAQRSPPTLNANEEAQLVWAILTEPDADGHRLVYADWLTERGQARGEFINLQVKRAQAGGAKPSKAEASLFSLHRGAILGPFDGVLEKAKLVVERGFVVEGRTQKTLPKHPLTRLLRSLDFRGNEGVPNDVVLDRLMHAVTPLALLPSVLAAAPNLRSLKVEQVRRFADMVSLIAQRRLEEFSTNLVPDFLPLHDAMSQLFATPCGKALKRLTFSITTFIENDATRLVSPPPPHLDVLVLDRPHVAHVTFERAEPRRRLKVRLPAYSSRRMAALTSLNLGTERFDTEVTLEGTRADVTAELEYLKQHSVTFTVNGGF